MSYRSIRFNKSEVNLNRKGSSSNQSRNFNNSISNLKIIKYCKNEQDIPNNFKDDLNDDTTTITTGCCSFSGCIMCLDNQHLLSNSTNFNTTESTNLKFIKYQKQPSDLKLNLNYLKLDSFDRKIFCAQDERDAMQKKTFTKWINKYLNEIGTNINDLYEDLKDGTNLLLLLQILTKKKFTKEKGSSKFHSLQNIQICLDFLKSNKVSIFIYIHLIISKYYSMSKLTLKFESSGYLNKF
ncbi:unnamed protein product [Brachionus calyciflorus]|uniref:Calponin-homology (CH) domain-containing protein n=1 Tax=Brachionus calyciflorus TaxID=104777 RepID=A0A813LZQ0_9BILA|nr:unnamed protein product [Brachionus calyciflorus]